MISKFYILVCFFVLLLSSCTEKDYDFTYYYEFEGDDYLYIKGEKLTSDLKPEGEYIFFDHEGKKSSEGAYKNGQKRGEWGYNYENGDTTIIWKGYQDSLFSLSILDGWILHKQNDHKVHFVSLTEDSLIYERVGIRFFANFNVNSISKQIVNEMKSKRNAVDVIDYSGIIQDLHGTNDIKVFQFSGRDESGHPYLVFYFITEDVINKKAIVVYYLTPYKYGDLKFRLFKDLITDIYYDGRLLLGKRWNYLK